MRAKVGVAAVVVAAAAALKVKGGSEALPRAPEYFGNIERAALRGRLFA